MENKEASVTNVYSQWSCLPIKNKNEDADDIVFHMICKKNVVSRLNVVLLI